MIFKKLIVFLLQKLSSTSPLSCRLTKLTAKSNFVIHPKHLVKIKPWYLDFVKPDDLILDIGCGVGVPAIKVAPKVKKVIGFDINKRSIKIAKAQARIKELNNVKFLFRNAEKKLPFRDNFFDLVFCFAVLEHVKNQKLLLSEIKRVLKPKGRFLLSLPNSQTSWKNLQKSVGLSWYSDPDHKREYSLKQIKRLLKTFKFRIVKIKPVALDTPFAGLIDLLGGFSLEVYKRMLDWKQKMAKKFPKETISFEIVAHNE